MHAAGNLIWPAGLESLYRLLVNALYRELHRCDISAAFSVHG